MINQRLQSYPWFKSATQVIWKNGGTDSLVLEASLVRLKFSAQFLYLKLKSYFMWISKKSLCDYQIRFFSIYRWEWRWRGFTVLDRLSRENPGSREGFGPGFSCQTQVNHLSQLPWVAQENIWIKWLQRTCLNTTNVKCKSSTTGEQRCLD